MAQIISRAAFFVLRVAWFGGKGRGQMDLCLFGGIGARDHVAPR
jgi:hypothetical protein